MKPVISVIGSFVVGLSVRLPRQPHPGETLEGDLFDIGPGGKGNNAAIAASRLGAEIVLVERIGSDIFAQMAIDLNKSENIDTSHILLTDGAQTGIGLVYLQQDGENTIALFKGANQLLSAEDIRNAKDDIVRGKVLLAQMEVPDEALSEAFGMAKRHGMTIILNPAPARQLPFEILNQADIVTPNQTELFTMLGKTVPERQSVKDIERAARELLDRGLGCVIVTMGSRGALLVRKNRESVFQPSFPVNAVDTVGAGDSFNAGLAVAVAEGKTLDEALLRACANGALTATGVGVIGALPTREKLEQFIKENQRP